MIKVELSDSWARAQEYYNISHRRGGVVYIALKLARISDSFTKNNNIIEFQTEESAGADHEARCLVYIKGSAMGPVWLKKREPGEEWRKWHQRGKRGSNHRLAGHQNFGF